VKTLQQELGRLNCYEGPIDGIRGTQTVQAIQYLPRNAGLAQTGQMKFRHPGRPALSGPRQQSDGRLNAQVATPELVRTARLRAGDPARQKRARPSDRSGPAEVCHEVAE
jgi:peptidoglycan hydrolase-like protein with peptidoglycan-binding domain